MIADVGGTRIDPSPDREDAEEIEAASEARDAIAWRFESQLEALVDIAMLVAIPALFLMAMLALVIPI